MKHLRFLVILLLGWSVIMACQEPDGPLEPINPNPQPNPPTPITAIYSPINGQSNAVNWKNFQGDQDSGASILEDSLESGSNLPVVTLLKGSDGKFITPATGGSTVDNLTTSQPDEKIWWYLPENVSEQGRPGGALVRSLDILRQQYADMLNEYGDSIVIAMPWSQGEHNVGYIARRTSTEEKFRFVERYKIGTKAVFNYLQQEIGIGIEFFIVKTRPIDEEGAVERGLSPEEIIDGSCLAEGTVIVLEARNDNEEQVCKTFKNFGGEIPRSGTSV